MSEELHFSKSPLTEAVIDIRVTLAEGFQSETLASVQLGEETRYPKREDRLFLEEQLSADVAGPSIINSRTHIGYVFTNSDGRQIFQARLDGFTFSRLALTLICSICVCIACTFLMMAI